MFFLILISQSVLFEKKIWRLNSSNEMDPYKFMSESLNYVKIKKFKLQKSLSYLFKLSSYLLCCSFFKTK